MVATVKRPDRELLPILAQDQLLLGDRAAAEETYRKLLKAAPDDVPALRRVAAFFASQDPALAERSLRHAVELEPASRPVQLELAALLIARGSGDQLAEAMRLLQGAADAKSADNMEQSLLARLLLRRAQGDDHERAKQLLENLVAEGEASDDDHTTLVGLYQAEGRLRKATEHAFALATRRNPTPASVANYIDLLLKDQRVSEARPWLAKLSKLDPDSFATVNLSARQLAAEGKKKDAEKIVEAYLQRRLADTETADDKAQLLLAVGRLYSQIDLASQAERVLRQLAAASPLGYQHLATWLAKQERSEEAVDLCLQAAQRTRPPKARSRSSGA